MVMFTIPSNVSDLRRSYLVIGVKRNHRYFSKMGCKKRSSKVDTGGWQNNLIDSPSERSHAGTRLDDTFVREREREKALTRNRMKVGSSFKTTALISGILVYVCTGGAGGSNRAGALRTKGWRRLENAFPVGYLDQPRKEDRFQGSFRATCARSPSSSVTSKKDLKERGWRG